MDKMIFDLQRFATGIYSDDYTISKGGEYYISSDYTGKITVATTDAVTLRGSDSMNEVQIVSSVENMNLTIKDLNITNDTDSVIKFGSGSGNVLILDGTSNLTVNDGDNAAVNSGGGLVINGKGTLKASADRGAGVGSDAEGSVGSITISGGNVNASSVSGAGIGSGYGGSIRGILIRFSANINASSYHGAGIGRGQEGSSGSISIRDEAQVVATTEGSESGDVISALDITSGKISIDYRESTYTQNKVTINNAAETSVTINDTTYTGETLTFYDGTPALEITAGGEYTINENNYLVTITTPEAVTLKGDGSALSDVQIVATTTAADLTIENLMISNSEGNVIKLANNRIHKLNIEGANILTTTDENAAAINIGGGLTIDGKGLLIASAKNGAGIGGDARSHVGRLTIDGGFIVADSEGGAGIGIGRRGSANSISIGSGTIIFASAKVTEDFDWDNVPCGIATSDDKSITVSEEDTLLVVTNTNPYAAPKINGTSYEGSVIAFQNGKYVSSIIEAGNYDADDFSEDTVLVSAAEQSVEIFMNDSTRISPLSGDIKLTNYDASTKSGVNMRTDDFFTAVQEDYVSFAESAVSFGDAKISYDSELLNIYDSNNKRRKVGFAEGSKIDASAEKKSVTIFSNGNSTLTGGSGNDTIFAGSNDIIDAGAGKNQIFLPEENDSGTTIILSAGKTTVENFGANDVIDADIFSADVTFENGDLIIRDGDGKILLNDISDENFVTIMFGENKVAVAEKDSVIEVAEDLPDIFVGKNSAVDFSNYGDEISIDLAGENFRGINKIIAGSGETTIKGSDANEIFVSGGATNFYLSGGRDVIENFSSTDKIFAEDEISKATADLNGNVIIETGNGILQIDDAAGKNIEINSVVTQIARKELIFDGEAEKFIATSSNATVEVAESLEGVEIILSDGNFEGDIKILDGSKNSGASKLYGNDFDNKIIASGGGSELWGGVGNDTLIGGDGDDTFIYTAGNDKVSGASANDTIYLRDLTLDKIIGQEISDSSIKLNFDGGGSLSLDTNEGTAFNVEGANYVYNKESGKWDEK